MKTRKNSIFKYLLELLIVAFGVFLGIMVSEYRAQTKIDANVSKSFNFIIEELNNNSLKLGKAIKYHQTIKIGFDSLRTNITREMVSSPYFSNTVFRHSSIPGWQGLGIFGLENIAFESAKISGIFQEMDIETVQLISNAYKNLESNTELGKNLLDKLIGINSDTKILDVIGIFELLTNDVLGTEKHFKSELDTTIEQLRLIQY